MLDAEMNVHVGYRKGELPNADSTNRRNGSSPKTLTPELGPVPLSISREREGSFAPKAMPKHAHSCTGVADKVLALYARGMSTRDIQGHLYELYATEVSANWISGVTEEVMDEIKACPSCSLDGVYPIVYFDALVIKVSEQGVVRNKSV